MMAKPSPTSMRLLLLPISTRRSLIYCEPASHSLPTAQQTYLDRGVNYASKTWAEWEKGDPRWYMKWKAKTTYYGNKMLRRIPFEEWGLKSLPSLTEKRKAEYEDNPTRMRVEIRYPGLYQGLLKDSVLDVCKRLSTERQSLHKRKMIQSALGMPLTIPFGLLPVVPNLPFFYLAFRFYSHWRALMGSRHLEHIVNANLLSPSPSKTLDSLYSAGLIYGTRDDSRNAQDPSSAQNEKVVSLIRQQMSSASKSVPLETKSVGRDERAKTDPGQSEEEEEIMLLKGWNGKLLAERLGLPGLEVEIERAVEQVESNLQGATPRQETDLKATKAGHGKEPNR